MTAPAVPFYPRVGPWHGRAVVRKKPTNPNPQVEDPPAVVVPPDLPVSSGPAAVKWFYGLAVAQCAVLTVVIGSYFSIKGTLEAQQRDINAIKAWMKKPGEFPATKGVVTPDATTQTVPMPGPSSTAAPSAAVVDSPPRPMPIVTSVPSSVRPVPPPVCVSPKTKHRFSCEDATGCYPESAFNPDFFEALKHAAHAESITVCDHK